MLLNPFRFTAIAPPPSGDPSFANVVSLLHFDGANGDTTFPDEKGNTYTKSGSPTTQSSPKVFGTASGRLASADRLALPALGTPIFGGLFTLEFFLGLSQTSGTSYIMGATTGGFFWIQVTHTATGALLRATIGGSTTTGDSSARVPLSGFSHIAVTRDGSNVMRLFIDGALQGSVVSSLVFTSGPLWLSGNSSMIGGQPTLMNIDEFRLTNGVCRYTSSFTPPTEAYPNA
jgi:hypothetical protein